jgi:hypothetical protein
VTRPGRVRHAASVPSAALSAFDLVPRVAVLEGRVGQFQRDALRPDRFADRDAPGFTQVRGQLDGAAAGLEQITSC